MNVSFFIARRYLLKQKGAFSSFIIRLCIISTALSVAVMIMAVAFMTGFKYEIREKLFSFWGHIHISPYNPNAYTIITPDPMKADKALEQQIRKLPHITQMAPYAVRPAIVHAHQLMEGIRLKGIEPDYKFNTGISFTGKSINFSDSAYSKQILLSQATADRLNLKAGEEVLLYFPMQGNALPRVRKVLVAGIFHTGMEDIDHYFGVCDIRLLQHISNWGSDEINGYQLDLDDASLADSLSVHIFKEYIQPPLHTASIRDLYENIFDWLNMQNINVRILIIIMSLVAIINMAATLVILMVDRARMIGIFKALGMPFSQIRWVFLYIAGLISTWGIVLGNLLGLGICWLQKTTGFITLPEDTYYVQRVPVRLYTWHVLVIDVTTLLVCVLCMWLPSLYIRRIQPARVLQFK